MPNKNVIMCDPATLAKDCSGKTYIITGSNSGVGFETAKHLFHQGAHVVLACRRVEAGKEAAKQFHNSNGSFEVIKCDLADLESVRSFVKTFLSKNDRLDGLVCNAGMVNMENTPKYTDDGLETTMAISYFGHFLMTELLIDKLVESTPSRMVILSSVGHAGSSKYRYKVHLDDLNWKKRKFNNISAYAEAKVAANLYALELSERLKDTGVTTYSVHPGWARSNFGGGGNLLIKALMAFSKPILKILNFSDSSWESAQTTLHCLLSDEAPNYSGQYFSQHSVLYRDKECKKGGWPMKSPNPNAYDIHAAKELVKLSRDLVNLNS